MVQIALLVLLLTNGLRIPGLPNSDALHTEQRAAAHVSPSFDRTGKLNRNLGRERDHRNWHSEWIMK
jgi:hypothetical protein